jgi:hypothetical protein
MLGLRSRVMLTVEVDAGQTPFTMENWKTLSPPLSPVTAVEGLLGFENVPDPATTDQLPVPEVTGVATSVELAEQSVALLPALAMEGGRSLLIETVAVDEGQTPFEVVH